MRFRRAATLLGRSREAPGAGAREASVRRGRQQRSLRQAIFFVPALPTPRDPPTTLLMRRPICRRDLTRGTSREQFETCRPRKKAAARGADSNGLQATRHRDEIGRGPVRVARAGERRSYDRCPRRAWNRWHPRLGRSCACGPVFREALNHVSRLGPERPGSPRSFLNPPRSTKARLARRVGPSGSFCRTERYET